MDDIMNKNTALLHAAQTEEKSFCSRDTVRLASF